jgi:RHS repeat-associated protein
MGTVLSTKTWVWCGGTQPCEERDGDNQVTQRFFAQGFQRLAPYSSLPASFYYTNDHLGSIREVLDATGTLRARYDYDAWGQRTKLSGDLEADFGFTGHLHHKPTGLILTHYRAYDPRLARWLSRDPIAERGGINLYGYVGNDPINMIDTLGLDRIISDGGHTTVHVQNESGGWTKIHFGPKASAASAVGLVASRSAWGLGPLGKIATYGMFGTGDVIVEEDSNPDRDFGKKCRTKSSREDDQVLLDFARELARQEAAGEITLPYGCTFNCRHFTNTIKDIGRNSPPRVPSILDGPVPSVLP